MGTHLFGSPYGLGEVKHKIQGKM